MRDTRVFFARADMMTAQRANDTNTFRNPGAASSMQAYGAAHAAILNDTGFTAALDEIRSWPGYAPTSLHRLPGLAASLGIAELHYKDEGSRFGLKSFK